MKILSEMRKKLTSFYNSVSGNLKKLALILFSRKKVIIDYNFNMKDYFTLDGKIEENRRYLREQFEMYKKIENYYPIFLAFLGFIGVYYFDFITILNSNFNVILLLLTIITTIGILLSIYYMIMIISLNEWHTDKIPSSLYKTYYAEFEEYAKDNEGVDIEEEVKKGYLDALESGVSKNQITYNNKKNRLVKLLQIIIITLFVYSLNIIYFKNYKIMCEKKEKPKTTLEITNEGLVKINEIDINKREELRKIIRAEIDLYEKEKLQNKTNNEVKGMNNLTKNMSKKK